MKKDINIVLYIVNNKDFFFKILVFNINNGILRRSDESVGLILKSVWIIKVILEIFFLVK